MKKQAIIAAATTILMLAGCHHRHKKAVEGNNMSAPAANTMSANETDKSAVSNGSNAVAPTSKTGPVKAGTNGDRVIGVRPTSVRPTGDRTNGDRGTADK